ncbi:uncharacterized protein Mb2253c-like [Telopea speciosissima]|uniref:uncharacterized protein Mb2253c-like n=1 Tax=Telopea speciosissima TaxID=54955 RepID=UPI001CC789EB|nr:uncharacterized protein Mb2253c-like [Telopea speciosissima]
MVKINVDGACKGNPGVGGGGGGIVRDKEGVVIAAFSKFYGDYTNTIAELRALNDGLKLCAKLEATGIVVNSDSKVTIQSIAKGRCGSWKGWYWFQETMELARVLKPMIYFTFREGNRAADGLAKLSCDSAVDTEFQGGPELPPDLRRIKREDACGLPVLRK